MNTSESFQALRRANPRAKTAFADAVEAAAHAVQTQIGASTADVAVRQGRFVRFSTVGAVAAAAATAVALLTVASPGGGPGLENADAAIRQAATVTAASAERSGTVVVRITHDGELWAGTTIRWRGGDVAVFRDAPQRPGRAAGAEFLVVDGIMYGFDPGDGGWVVFGSPKNIDPDSGTTPDEYLAAVREDVGGVTLRRITGGMTRLTTSQRGDGSKIYQGTVQAGLIARETGFKGRQPIRVLPFGYVAHDEAADPAAPLVAAVAVSADGIVREIAVTWGTGASTWRYTVEYRDLGATAAPVAPENARPLRDRNPG